MKKLMGKIVMCLSSLMMLVGCSPETAESATYSVEIDPNNFVTTIDNPYFPRLPGSKYVYEGHTEEGMERVVLEILGETKVVMGVTTTIMRDTVTIDGEIVEDTYDWFAQDKEGNVWYFGEAVNDYENGQLVSKAGSWEAGVDGALPGIVMYGTPAAHVGEVYLQEYYKGEAEDTAELISANEAVTIPLGNFDDVIQTYDYTPLDAEAQEHKFFAAGIGEIKAVDLNTGDEVVLVEFSPAE